MASNTFIRTYIFQPPEIEHLNLEIESPTSYIDLEGSQIIPTLDNADLNISTSK